MFLFFSFFQQLIHESNHYLLFFYYFLFYLKAPLISRHDNDETDSEPEDDDEFGPISVTRARRLAQQQQRRPPPQIVSPPPNGNGNIAATISTALQRPSSRGHGAASATTAGTATATTTTTPRRGTTTRSPPTSTPRRRGTPSPKTTSTSAQKRRLASLPAKAPANRNERVTKDLSLSEQYKPTLVMFFNWRDNPSPQWNKHSVFTQDRLYTIKPGEIVRFMQFKVYGMADPGVNDMPTLGRSSSLEYYKKALSHFMPDRLSPWNVKRHEGNPTRSVVVNNLIKLVKKKEVRKQGKKSQARSPFTEKEYEYLMALLEANENLSKEEINTLFCFSHSFILCNELIFSFLFLLFLFIFR